MVIKLLNIRLLLLVLMAMMHSLAISLPAKAGSFDFMIVNANPKIEVRSMRERKFSRIVKQQFDFSCGSAALASLLTYHYDIPKTENDVFLDMWASGEQENIRKNGFSLLDMQTYLRRNNLKADGFEMTLERIKEIGVPGIALIDVKGYKHFVIIKGIHNGNVLIGDPSAGMTVKTEREFNAIWDGSIFFIRSHVDRGKRNFNNVEDWATQPTANLAAARTLQSVQRQTLHTTRSLNSGFTIRSTFK